MLFYIYIIFFTCIYIFKFTFLVLRSYCNAQLKIYIDNCAIEINKIIIIYYYYLADLTFLNLYVTIITSSNSSDV